jgi:hypothetical protein
MLKKNNPNLSEGDELFPVLPDALPEHQFSISGVLKRAFFFIIFFLFFITTFCNAQLTDTSTTEDIPSEKKIEIHDPNYHSPKKAALMSTIFPGLGQAYNKKYWKMPLIYAGFLGLAYSLHFNQIKFTTYRDAYKYRIDGNPATVDNYVGIYSDDNLFTLQKAYHRYRDLSVIGIALLYVLNIVDASVDAHMFTFDVGDDLSFSIHPTLINTASLNQYNIGFSLNIKF